MTETDDYGDGIGRRETLAGIVAVATGVSAGCMGAADAKTCGYSTDGFDAVGKHESGTRVIESAEVTDVEVPDDSMSCGTYRLVVTITLADSSVDKINIVGKDGSAVRSFDVPTGSTTVKWRTGPGNGYLVGVSDGEEIGRYSLELKAVGEN